MSTASLGRDREWRPVPSFPGYEASNAGEIRSQIPWKGTPLPRTLRKHRNPDGYEVVRPRNPNGKNVTVTVHRMVAEAFHGPRPDGLMVRHLNGDKADNRPDNLRYGTRSENGMDAVRHGVHFPARLTVCQRGHELTGGNVYIYPSTGKRMCKACAALRRQGRAA